MAEQLDRNPEVTQRLIDSAIEAVVPLIAENVARNLQLTAPEGMIFRVRAKSGNLKALHISPYRRTEYSEVESIVAPWLEIENTDGVVTAITNAHKFNDATWIGPTPLDELEIKLDRQDSAQ